MKTSFKLVGLLFMLLFFTQACKKDNPAPQPKPITGVWTGYYTVTNDPTQNFLSFDLKLGAVAGQGTLDVYDQAGGGVVGTGTWTLTDQTLDVYWSYTANPNTHFSYTAQFDSVSGALSNGTWGLGLNKSGGGTWSMTK